MTFLRETVELPFSFIEGISLLVSTGYSETIQREGTLEHLCLRLYAIFIVLFEPLGHNLCF